MEYSADTASTGHNGPVEDRACDTLSRMQDGQITAWPPCMELRYGFTAQQAVGQVSHRLLQTTFPLPLPDIEAILSQQRCWHGGLIHKHADGHAILVISRWDLNRQGNNPDDVTVTETHSEPNGVEMADLFAIMASELSQPLTAIANYVNAARRSLQNHAADVETARAAMALAAGQVELGAAQVRLMRRLAGELRHIG
jgi:signal transduction histidine kinase